MHRHMCRSGAGVPRRLGGVWHLEGRRRGVATRQVWLVLADPAGGTVAVPGADRRAV